MEVVRFLTECELHTYLAGGKLMNATKHVKNGMVSTSVGFCFAEVTEGRDADKWLRKLGCIRPCEYCIVFDTDDFKVPLVESKANYADDNNWQEDMVVREWCTTSYQLDTHPYKRIGKCPSICELLIGRRIQWVQENQE